MRRLPVFLLLLTVLLAACAPGPGATPDTTAAPAADTPVTTAAPTEPPAASEAPAMTEVPTAAPTAAPGEPVEMTEAPTQPAVTEAPTLSFEELAFSDPAGFSLDYPAAWQVDDVSLGSRARMVQFTSWAHEAGSIAEVPAGESILQAQVQQWDPKGDLDAYLQQRKSAWLASGIEIVKEENLELPGLGPALEVILKGGDGEQSYVLITVLGEEYLVLSGNGDLELLAEIGRTLRGIS